MSKLKINSILPDVTHMDYVTLKTIERCSQKNKVRVSDIVHALKSPAPAVSRQLRVLEKKGMLTRAVDTSDRRNTFVTLTSEGEKVVKQVSRELDDFSDTVFAAMGEEKVRQLNESLKQLIDIAQREIERRKGEKEEQ